MKKLTTLLFAILLLSTPVPAQETEEVVTESGAPDNLLKNSDMSRGTSGWTGDRTLAEDGDNWVLVVRAKKGSERIFSQEFHAMKAADLKISFRYKTEDYKGRGLKISMVYGNSSWYTDMDLKADGEWHEVNWKFSEGKGKTKLTLQFNVKEGEGTVFFDDITAVDRAK